MRNNTMVACMRMFMAIICFLNVGFTYPAQAQTQEQAIVSAKSLKDNLNIDIVSAEVKDGVLTIMMKPQPNNDVRAGQYNMSQAYYVVKNKQYLPLKMGGDIFTSELYPNMKKMFWIKFPAPEGNAPTIDFYLPDIAPIEKLPITYK